MPRTYDQRGNEDRRYPVLYMNDGFAVFKQSLWNGPAIVSGLIREKKITEMILVGIDNGATASNGSPDQRTNEYVPFADTINEPDVPLPHGYRYPEFLTDEVMPAVAARYRVMSDPEHVGLGGASYGGLAALYTVVHRPGVFGQLLLESTPTFMSADSIIKDPGKCTTWPGRVHIGIGTEETDDESLNRSAIPRAEHLRDLIVGRSPATRAKVVIGSGDAHSSRSWSRRFPGALEFLFGTAH